MPKTQSAARRQTEGPKATGAVSKGRHQGGAKTEATKRGPGRPVGSKNKPKSIIPTELADRMLLKMEGTIPPEHFTYLRGVIRDGKAISTKRELDTLILILSRNLMPALVEEMDGEDIVKMTPDGEVIGDGRVAGFRKDVTERLKVLNSFLSLRHQVEKREEDTTDGPQPLLKVWASRDLSGRLAILVGDQRSDLVGDVDVDRGQANRIGALPDTVSERPERLPSGEQVSPDRVLDLDSGGDSLQGSDPEKLSG